MVENSPPFRLHAMACTCYCFFFFAILLQFLEICGLVYLIIDIMIRLPDDSIRADLLRFTFAPISTAPLVNHGAVPIDILYIASMRQHIVIAALYGTVRCGTLRTFSLDIVKQIRQDIVCCVGQNIVVVFLGIIRQQRDLVLQVVRGSNVQGAAAIPAVAPAKAVAHAAAHGHGAADGRFAPPNNGGWTILIVVMNVMTMLLLL